LAEGMDLEKISSKRVIGATIDRVNLSEGRKCLAEEKQ
jgi:hypothetical protein